MKQLGTLLLVWLCTSLPALGQPRTKLSMALRAWAVNAGPTAQVDLFLAGPVEEVARAVRKVHGLPKLAAKGWLSATVPVSALGTLDADPAIRAISYSLAQGRALNDSMRVKAHVDEAHLGLAPLPAAYQGEGVLVGIIDTGLDFTHPDFLDSLGNTRVLRYWDQNFPVDAAHTPVEFGYGQAWDSSAINSGNCPATDLPQFGHGTTVGGTAAGNGSGNGHCTGVAPKAGLIVVANDLDRPNWSASVADAVQYILNVADSLDRPVAINLSLGDYYGSHDGLDPAALLIDSLLTAAPGRALVCAAGNSGALPPYHLRHAVNADTAFTWFSLNPNSALGGPAVYFDLWADSAAFSQVHWSVGADRIAPVPVFRGAIPYRTVAGSIGQETLDTLWSISGNQLGVVHTWAELRGGQVHMEVYIPQPDSAGQYHYRFSTTGTGQFDAWSSALFGTSGMVSTVPDTLLHPEFAHYVRPDSAMSIVDSWACSPNVVTVANYNNQLHYTDISGTPRDYPGLVGDLSATSSRGPTRTGLLKPDVAAPGDVTFSPGPLTILQTYLVNGVDKLIDSLHMRNGGTSIASPSVAGTAALLLEKCPMAGPTEILEALTASAFGDAYATNLPNPRFGHGKLNAFQALVHTNFPVAINGEAGACPGDSSLLAAPPGMLDYAWNDGSTLAEHWAQPGDSLWLTVHDQAGCLSMSDTLVMQHYPAPMAEITVDGLELSSSLAAMYQWYYEGEALPGANGPSWTAQANGNYFVHVWDSLGCTANSDTVLVLSVGVGEAAGEGMRVWPVPAQDVLHVQGLTEDPGAMSYVLSDPAGRLVQQGKLGPEDGRINVRRLPPGLYNLRWPAWPQAGSVRFIKE
jgi:hypothetical protein